MTLDDDRGYFLDVWVCQNGNYVWVPTSWTTNMRPRLHLPINPAAHGRRGTNLYRREARLHQSQIRSHGFRKSII